MVYYIYIQSIKQLFVHVIQHLMIFHLILCGFYIRTEYNSVYFDFVYSLIYLYANRVRYADDYLYSRLYVKLL